MPVSSTLATRLHYQHKSIVELIDGLTDMLLRKQTDTGKWSMFEHIVHLQTYQHTFVKRMQLLFEGNNPLFEAYTAEADPLFHDNLGKLTHEVIHDMLTVRKKMTEKLLSLHESDLGKTAIHPLYGKMNFLEWLDFFLLHEAHHIFTIFKMGAIMKKELRGV